jgi:hypothetical protein
MSTLISVYDIQYTLMIHENDEINSFIGNMELLGVHMIGRSSLGLASMEAHRVELINDRYVSDTANLYSDTANLYSDTDTFVLHIFF